MTRWFVLTSVLCTLSFVTPARAEDPAAAEALFREGRALYAAGQTDAACQKFKASQALEASPGTLLNLAACHREQGKTATAWAEFVAAARLARAQSKDRQEAEATRRAAELEPTLEYLTVRVADPVPGLEVHRDGSLLEPSVYGVRVPIDPGAHVIEVSAPGYQPLHLDAAIVPGRKDVAVDVPKLERQAASGAPTTTEPPVSSPPNVVTSVGPQPSPLRDTQPPSHALAWVVGGIGGAFLVTGAVSGVLALGSNHDASKLCPDASNCNDPSARSIADRRDTEALIADIGIGAGLVGIGVATYLLLTDKAPTAQGARALQPALAPGRAGLTFVERF